MVSPAQQTQAFHSWPVSGGLRPEGGVEPRNAWTQEMAIRPYCGEF